MITPSEMKALERAHFMRSAETKQFSMEETLAPECELRLQPIQPKVRTILSRDAIFPSLTADLYPCKSSKMKAIKKGMRRLLRPMNGSRVDKIYVSEDKNGFPHNHVEMEEADSADSQMNAISSDPDYWIPMQWAVKLLQRAYVAEYIVEPRDLSKLIEEVDKLRNRMHTLQIYSTILLPLVYTQVVIIAVYSYFFCQLFSTQLGETTVKELLSLHLNASRSNTSISTSSHSMGSGTVPIFIIFEFLFLIGWLK
ncbi:hypothetical protein Ciccas_013739, partial [Cichlidogyrus casuarinus]